VYCEKKIEKFRQLRDVKLQILTTMGCFTLLALREACRHGYGVWNKCFFSFIWGGAKSDLPSLE